jgi:hypothetical protein
MPIRRIVPVLLVVATAIAAPATAAPRRSCRLLGPNPSFVQSHGVDYEGPLVIRSADVASNRTHVTAVIRVNQLSTPADAATVRSFRFHFSRHREENYVLGAALYPGRAPLFQVGFADAPFNPQRTDTAMPSTGWVARATGVVDTARNEVRITAPLSALAKHKAHSLKRGRPVTYLAATTSASYGVAPGTVEALPDGARVGFGSDFTYGSTRVTYTLGAPSCVAVGR